MSSEEQPSRARRLIRLAAAVAAVRGLRRSKAVPAPPEPDGGPRAQAEPIEDPSERKIPASPRAETAVAILLAAGGLCGFGFLVLYIFASLNTQLLGLAFGVMLLLLAAASIVAGKMVVPQETKVEERDELLQPEELDDVIEQIGEVGEGVSRRGLIVGAGGVAGAGLLAAAVTPIASFGPKLNGIHATPWHRGRRMVDDSGNPYAASDILDGSWYSAFPEGADREQLGSPILLVRLPAHYLELPPTRRSWGTEAGGILAFSKICPHAACAISLYRYPTYAPDSGEQPAFTCPCHYSTFLPGQGGKLLFGPAGRDLPQLPVMIDSEGNLRAAGDFDSDVGPSWVDVRRARD